MGDSKYKEIIQGLLKSYSSLLLPVVIGLVGVLLFIPTQLMSNRLKEQIKTESVSMGTMLQSLGGVVPRDQYKEEEKYQQAYATDANRIDLLARQTAQRPLLSYEIFPAPRKDASVFIFDDFGRQFRGAVEKLVSRVNAGDCPTQAELDETKRSWRADRSRRYVLLEVGTAIEDDLCREKAEAASVYIDPADLGAYDFWGEFKYAKAESRPEAIRNCWYSQLAYWIIEDVVDTIAACNSESSTVFTSPVKRLVRVSFSKEGISPATTSTSRASNKASDTLPIYVLSAESGLTRPCTRRLSNDDIDIVHFEVSVVVSTKAVLPFMQKLCSAKQHEFKGWDGQHVPPQIFKHNQVTILEYKIESFDREGVGHSLYRYGEDAVVKLDLSCEYVFVKAGYDDVKPDVVKESIKKSLEEMEMKKGGREVQRPKRPSKPKPDDGQDITSLRIRR